jgi:hypothetical protein
MRNDSPLAACLAAAVILVGAAGMTVPGSAWTEAAAMTRLAPGLVMKAGAHGQILVRAARTGVSNSPALLRDPGPAPSAPEREIRVCRRDLPRACAQSDCSRRVWQRRIQLFIPISG